MCVSILARGWATIRGLGGHQTSKHQVDAHICDESRTHTRTAVLRPCLCVLEERRFVRGVEQVVAMHSVWVRLTAVVFFGLTVLALMAACCGMRCVQCVRVCACVAVVVAAAAAWAQG